MENPCEQCIVQPMCRKACESFKSYIKEFFKKYRETTLPNNHSFVGSLADTIKNGKTELTTKSRFGWRIIHVNNV